MSSSTLIIAEMLLTLGLCLGFGVYQLWDLRRENAKAAARDAAKAQRAAEAAKDREPSSGAAS